MVESLPSTYHVPQNREPFKQNTLNTSCHQSCSVYSSAAGTIRAPSFQSPAEEGLRVLTVLATNGKNL